MAILVGAAAVGAGMLVAMRSVRFARRAYRRTSSLSAVASEGWGTWFLGGFSDVTMGIRWLSALASLVAWTLVGVGLIGVGVRLVGG
ncbi:MAG: hypothetical protein L0Z62_08700 [Gemmataceae bacterium]|nr:hypothetical protein [Gemmataceae bacterium]